MSVAERVRRGVAVLTSAVKAALNRVRRRWPAADHLARALERYGDVLGGQLAAGLTYYAFLSFFPLIALTYAAVGYVVEVVPAASDAVTATLSAFLPGLIGTGPGRINVEEIASKKAGVGLIGLAGLLYTGLGVMSSLRTALQGVFGSDRSEDRRNVVVGKAIDLLVLVLIGLIGVVSVGTGASATGVVGRLTAGSGIPGLAELVWVVGVAVGIAASTVAVFVAYRLLPTYGHGANGTGGERRGPATKDLWRGALLVAVGFEVLKQLAGLLLGQVTGNVLYGAFAVMVALLVWLNYTARLVVLGGAWAAAADGSGDGGIPDRGEQGERPD